MLKRVELLFSATFRTSLEGRSTPSVGRECFVASALGHGITTEADTLSDLREMVKDAVQCHFHDAEQMPKIIRLHFVRDEVLSL